MPLKVFVKLFSRKIEFLNEEYKIRQRGNQERKQGIITTITSYLI